MRGQGGLLGENGIRETPWKLVQVYRMDGLHCGL